jgi:cytochrome b pre-mRNA-processing protein 3|tara:strand:+ start:1195 stop:1770 length:576 start_codon:yes stop_codon:yes gene_type:complete
MKLKEFFSSGPRDDAARRLYVSVVKQARQPGFYLYCGVPDTADGRFDMILLHAFLLLRRIKRDHDLTADLGQAFFDLMFADMDQNLREMGLGDLAVGKRVKGMAAAFYGRIQAYEDGLADDETTLVDSLGRNLYRKTEPDDSQLSTVSDYMRREAARLDDMDTDRLLAGKLDFGPAPADPGKPGLGKENQE